MSLVEIVNNVCMSELDRVASVIEGELKDECPKRTGQAAASIGISAPSDVTRRIGGVNDHLFFADQGNGGRGTIIKSTREYDRLGRRPGKLVVMNGMYTSYRNSVHGYEGRHFVEKVAARHR